MPYLTCDRVLPSMLGLVARLAASLVLIGVLLGCGGGGGAAASSPPPAASSSAPLAEVELVFFGNSHTSGHNVPDTVAALLRTARPQRLVNVTVSPDWMLLNARGDHAPSLDLLRSRRWTHVFLQAQDYSSSGAFTYPTTGAEKLVRLAREQGAQPILFAEWPRRGIDESARIDATYAAITQVQPACLPPIPQAFDLAAARHPALALHDADGNHSSPAGAFLAALLLFAVIDATPLDTLAPLSGIGVDANAQRELRLVARDTAAALAPRRSCAA